jgi:hypothetical protein
MGRNETHKLFIINFFYDTLLLNLSKKVREKTKIKKRKEILKKNLDLPLNFAC